MTWLHRVATDSDIATVSRLARAIWTEHFTPIIGQAQVSYMLQTIQSQEAITRQVQEKHYEYDLIVIDGEPVGYSALVPTADTMQLSKLYVLQEHRGRGVARSVVSQLEARCRERGVSELWLTVNRHNLSAIAFYENTGFSVSGPLVTDIGGGFVMDDYRMTKRLGSTLHA